MSIPSSLNFHSTASEVSAHYASQIRDKVVLVTGVSPNGLGAEASKAIAESGPKLLILAGRSTEK